MAEKICFGENGCYELLEGVTLVRNAELSDVQKTFVQNGLRQVGGEPNSTFRAYLARKEGEPTLRDIYEGNEVCEENPLSIFQQEICPEATVVTEEAARKATLEYMSGFRVIAQHIGPDSSHWTVLLLDNAKLSPGRARCDSATNKREDCLMDRVPNDLRGKRIILLPDGYTVSTEQYVVGDGVMFFQNGEMSEGEVVAMLYKDGGTSWSSLYRLTEEFLGFRCPVEENKDLFSVLNRCFAGAVALSRTVPARVAEHVK